MKLKDLRKSKGLTQQQLADLIGKDRSTVAKIENENASPSIETAKAIGRVLGVDWVVFFKDEGEEASHRNLTGTDC